MKILKKKLTQMLYSEQTDNEYRRLTYVRYADDFLIGIICSKEDAQHIKEGIVKLFKNKLKLELTIKKR